jgi:hypothetical protein
MEIPHFIYSFTSQCAFGLCLLFLVVMDNAVMNTGVQVFE